MKVVVCCKAVPVDVEPHQVAVADGEIKTGSRDLFINEADEYALEAALALKKVSGVETWALTLGTLRSQEALYIAIAKGIDHVMRVEGDTERPEVIAAGLIGVLKELRPELVFTGVQSQDWMGGEVGIYIAGALGMSIGYAVVEIVELDEQSVRVRKEIGGGRKLETVLKLPAMLCIQSGIQPLQYVSAMRRKKVRGTPITVGGTIDEIEMAPEISALMRYRAIEASAPEARTHAEMFTGERPEKIAKLLEIIRKNL